MKQSFLSDEMRAVLSPYMRQQQADMRKLHEDMKDALRAEVGRLHEASLLAAPAPVPAVVVSPPRRSPRLAPQQQQEPEESLDETVIAGPMFRAVRERMRSREDEAEGETAPLVTPKAATRNSVKRAGLVDITNRQRGRHLSTIEKTASPDLKAAKKVRICRTKTTRRRNYT